MKICIATHHFPPKFIGGAEQYALRLARHLLRNGHEVEVVTIDSITQGKLEPDSQTDCYEGIIVHRLTFNFPLATKPLRLQYQNPYLGAWFKDFLNKFRPDILHINSGYILTGSVIEEAHLLNIPIAMTLHEYWFLCPTNNLVQMNGYLCEKPVPLAQCKWCLMSKKRRFRLLDQKLKGKAGNIFVRAYSSSFLKKWAKQDEELNDLHDRRNYLSKIFQKLDLVISPSKFLIEKMKSYGFHHRNMVCLPYGLEHSFPSHDEEVRLPGSLRVGYLGRISHEKGIDILIKAVRRIPGSNIRLNIHGKINPESRYYRQLVKIAGNDPRIQFMGEYNQDQLSEIMKQLDVVVVPSRCYENRPGAILEAFVYKKPVVVTRLGGMMELVQHNIDGLFFELGDAEDLSIQLLRILNEPDLLTRLGMEIPPVEKVEEEIKQIERQYRMIAELKSSKISI
jgi:glycosyltransferase involved in cell wall biosynthesis